jgi:transcriptional regulator of PTS gene
MLMRLEESRLSTLAERHRARVLDAVANGGASARSQLVDRLGLRSTTVSHLVGELLFRRLLREVPGERRGRGRPALRLELNADRLGAIVLHCAGRTIAGTLIDLSGAVLAAESVAVDPGVDNAAMGAVLVGLAGRLRERLLPEMGFAGIGVALGGMIDLRRARWLISARWPRIDGLDVVAALEPVGTPVVVVRQLEAELLARLWAERTCSGGTILLHWGWGIGIAYAIDGETFNGAGGPFGEAGHWRFDALRGRACGCGNTGCLETGAALWALLPALRERWPDLGEDEQDLARQLRERDVLAVPAVAEAARLVARALVNLCLLLFPDRVMISGPLVGNAACRALFESDCRAEGMICGRPLPSLHYVSAGAAYLVRGAASPLLTQAVESLLRA